MADLFGNGQKVTFSPSFASSVAKTHSAVVSKFDPRHVKNGSTAQASGGIPYSDGIEPIPDLSDLEVGFSSQFARAVVRTHQDPIVSKFDPRLK